MTELMQALRDLSRDGFELFVHHFLRVRYPTANVTKIAGDGGDQGIDSFSGTLGKGPAVWQAKHFTNGIGRSQRQQILSSLDTALAARSLSYWTLCLPVDLNVEQRSWFQEKVEATYGNQVKINLLQGSDFIEEVSRNVELRNSFFPNNLITAALKVRDIFLKTDGATIPELHDMIAMQRDVLVERYAKLDTRFIPQVNIGPGSQLLPTHPGVILSKMSQDTRIDFIARDPIAYLSDPLKTKFTVSPQLASIVEEALDKGLPFTLPVGSVLSFKSSSPLLAELENLASGPEIRMTPNPPPEIRDQRLAVKMVSGAAEEPVTLPFFELRVIRFGRLEIELKSTQRCPVEVTVLITRNQLSDTSWKITVNLQLNCNGSDARAASNAIRFIESIDQTNQFKVVGLENGQVLMWSISGISGAVPMAKGFADLVHRTAKVADYFNQTILIPRHITEEDLDNLKTLYHVASGDSFEIKTWEGHIIKEEIHREHVAMMNAVPFSLTRPPAKSMENADSDGSISRHGPSQPFYD